MKYVSIDIETGGLDRGCSLLEFGAVVDDLNNPKPLSELPTFHTYVLNDRIVGEAYALAMHNNILNRIAKQEKPFRYTRLDELEGAFFYFLTKEGDYEGDPYPTALPGGGFKKAGVEISVAGKNFAMFDKDWLQPIFNKGLIRFFRRVIDPSILYFKMGQDKTLPDSKACMERAKLGGEVAHTAVQDAMMVVQLIRNALV